MTRFEVNELHALRLLEVSLVRCESSLLQLAMVIRSMEILPVMSAFDSECTICAVLALPTNCTNLDLEFRDIDDDHAASR